MHRIQECTGIQPSYCESTAVKLLLPGSILQRESCMTKSFICMMRITDQFLSDLKNSAHPLLTLFLLQDVRGKNLLLLSSLVRLRA